MKKLITMGAALIIAVFGSGCWSHPGGISPCTQQINSNDSYTVIKRNVTGTDHAGLLLTFPLGQPSVEKALKDVLDKYKADALINVTVDNSYTSFLVFTVERVTIHGDAIKINKNGSGRYK